MVDLIAFGRQSRQAMLSGLARLAHGVKAPPGVKGHINLDNRSGSPMITRDGVIVAKEIDLRDPAWSGR